MEKKAHINKVFAVPKYAYCGTWKPATPSGDKDIEISHPLRGKARRRRRVLRESPVCLSLQRSSLLNRPTRLSKSPTPSVPSAPTLSTAPDLELIFLGLINSGLAVELDELLAISPGFTRFLHLEQRRPQLTVRAFREKPGS